MLFLNLLANNGTAVLADMLYTTFCGSLMIFPLLYIAGAVACLWYRRLSRWLLLTMIGFWGQAIFSGFLTCSSLTLKRVQGSMDFDMSSLLIIGNVLAILMTGLIIWGLTMALADIWRQMGQLREMMDEPYSAEEHFPRVPSSDAARPFRKQKPGGPDIQR